jgi:hypothetical protein
MRNFMFRMACGDYVYSGKTLTDVLGRISLPDSTLGGIYLVDLDENNKPINLQPIPGNMYKNLV